MKYADDFTKPLVFVLGPIVIGFLAFMVIGLSADSINDNNITSQIESKYHYTNVEQVSGYEAKFKGVKDNQLCTADYIMLGQTLVGITGVNCVDIVVPTEGS